jgi:hypothetical protein
MNEKIFFILENFKGKKNDDIIYFYLNSIIIFFNFFNFLAQKNSALSMRRLGIMLKS